MLITTTLLSFMNVKLIFKKLKPTCRGTPLPIVALVLRINPATPYDPLPQIQLVAIDSHLHILHGELELQEML